MKSNNNLDPAKTLHQRAEEMARASPANVVAMDPDDLQRLVYELQVHQIELQLQNEELRDAQVELSESRDRYSDLYEFAPVAYVTFSQDGQILEANLTAASMFGVERQVLLRMNLTKFVACQSQDAWYLHRREVLSTSVKQICELNMHTADDVPLIVRLESIAQEMQNERQCRTAMIDITDLRQARQQLQESERRYRRLTEAVTDYIYRVCVKHGRPVETVHGTGCEAVTGYTAGELANDRMLWIAMVPPDDRAAVERQAACILSGQDAPPIEHRIRRKDGQIRWVLNTVSPQHDEQGRLIAYDGLLRDITDRKEADEALQKLTETLEQRVDQRTAELAASNEQLYTSQRRLKLAHEAGGMGTWDWDVASNYGVCDDVYHRLHGRSPDNVVNTYEKWMACIHPDDRQRVQQAVDRLFHGDGDWLDIEYRVVWPDESVHWLVGRGRVARDDRGHPARMTGVNFEITERKLAEQRITLLAAAISHLGEGVMITDDHLDWPGPHIVFINDAMCQISGYSADELLGQSPRILQGEKTSAEARAHLREELGAGRSCLIELVNYRKDGTPYDAELFITPLFDKEGRRTNFVSIHRDITHRKRAEADLLEREERLRAVLNTAADAIITIDQHGTNNGINRATEQIFGYTESELIGQNVSVLMPAPFCDEHDKYIARYLETGEPHIIGIGREVAGKRKDGSTFSVDLAVSDVGHLGLFTGVIRDISERKSLQRDVLAIAEDEQRRIGQDLHDSTQQELAGLGMLAQMLLNHLVGAFGDADKRCDLAKKVADGISRVNQEVQGISRGLVPIRLDPKGLMDALRELALRTDQLDGISCAFKCERPVEVTDSLTATHVYRIAQEAITNALKHARPEHILIALESDNGHPVLQVADDGIGFDSSSEQSQGMGLKTMHYRASLIGANVTVTPVEAGGTLVTCKLFGGRG